MGEKGRLGDGLASSKRRIKEVNENSSLFDTVLRGACCRKVLPT